MGNSARGRIMKTVVVTGGAGFLGSHIVHRLIGDPHVEKVVVIDSLLTGDLSNLPEDEKIEFHQTDVIDTRASDFKRKISEIYHLACPASPIHYERNPVHTLKSAVIGTMNMLDVATAHEAKILITSTSEVYGDPAMSPQYESYNGNVPINGTRSCYDEGKRAAESLAFDYWRMYKTRIKVARLFNTYGPNMKEDDGRVVSNFIVQAIHGLPLTVYGDGSQTRSFCYVDDMIEALFRFMDTNYDVKGPINLGNPDEYTIKEIAETISRAVGIDNEVTHRSLPSDDPRQRKPAIGLAQEVLNWTPHVTLKEGIRLTVQYFRNRIGD